MWTDAFSKKVYCKRLAELEGCSTLRVGIAYRTVAEPAVIVFAAEIPAPLLDEERKAIYKSKGKESRKVVNLEERLIAGLGKRAKRTTTHRKFGS